MNEKQPPPFATNVFDAEFISTDEDILKHNWFWFGVCVVVFLVGVVVDIYIIEIN